MEALEIEEFGALRAQRLGADALRAAGGLRLTQVRVLQNTVFHVGRVRMQGLAFLAEKDLTTGTAPAARWPPPSLQHARFLRSTPLPAGRGRECSGSPPPSGSAPWCLASHLSAGAARPPSSANGLSQPQKPLSERRSSATCWLLGSWRSGQ